MTLGTTPPGDIDEYIAGFPRSVQRVLERVRSTIRKAVPAAEETITYRMPTYTLHGRYMLYFAGWKRHYSLYPATDRLAAAFKHELARYEVSGRGTIRFPLAEPVPVRLIAGIARFRAKEVAERGRLRSARTPATRSP